MVARRGSEFDDDATSTPQMTYQREREREGRRSTFSVYTLFSCVTVCSGADSSRLHIFAVQSSEHDARYLPSASHLIALTSSVWPPFAASIESASRGPSAGVPNRLIGSCTPTVQT